MPDLQKRRKEMLNDHAAMEKHDPHWKAHAADVKSGFAKGTPIGQRAIAFRCDNDLESEVVVLSECVYKVTAGLQMFLKKAKNDKDLKERREKEPLVKQAFAAAEKFSTFKGNELRVSTQAWNSIVFCLSEAGVEVSMTHGN